MRKESDTLGSIEVPDWAYWGASTERARANFPNSGRLVPLEIIHAIGTIKAAGASVNCELGKLDRELARFIVVASREVASGMHDGHFLLDVFQTGSGTSTNMNVNEVIANRANEIAGFPKGNRRPVHPNDHVNLGQSSNDVFPSALHVAVSLNAKNRLLPELDRLEKALLSKAKDWDDAVKPGRTHLMDAAPVRMGQVFSGYAEQTRLGVERIESSLEGLKFLALGGSAVGTGINTHPEFGGRVAEALSKSVDMPFCEAGNHFEAQGSKDALLHHSGALRTVAVSLSKIAGDIRLMGSGPNCGFGELILPEIQPGSSIMPGKVNPVICESVIQMSIRAISNDFAVSLADFGGVGSMLELNVAMPLIGDALLESSRLVSESARIFREKLLSGLQVNREKCERLAGYSLMVATRLVPFIGYDETSKIVKRAEREGLTIMEAASGLLPEEKLEEIFDLRSMTEGK